MDGQTIEPCHRDLFGRGWVRAIDFGDGHWLELGTTNDSAPYLALWDGARFDQSWYLNQGFGLVTEHLESRSGVTTRFETSMEDLGVETDSHPSGRWRLNRPPPRAWARCMPHEAELSEPFKGEGTGESGTRSECWNLETGRLTDIAWHSANARLLAYASPDDNALWEITINWEGGNLSSIDTWRGAERDGYALTFDDAGGPLLFESYQAGVRHGLTLAFDRHGAPIAWSRWVAGVLDARGVPRPAR